MVQFTTRWAQPIVILLMSLSAFGLSKGGESSDSEYLQLSGLKTAASTEAEPGMPERGRFLMIYTYQGQSIEPDISVTLNGEAIASLNQLTPVTWTTLVDLETEKGDQAVLDAHFMDDGGSIALHNSFGSLTQGYWANQFNINFYLRDEEGNFVEHLGTMSIAFYLFPPFEGFVIDADPTKIAPGEESRVHFESVELPDEPVIVPGNTAVDFRLSPNGWRLGGYALPMLDAENLSAIVNMPYAFMANTPIYYRADPDSTLLEGTSEEVQLGIFSHFNTSISGQTEVEVSMEEDEEYEIFVTSDKEFVFPQKVTGDSASTISVLVLEENNPVSEFPVSIQVKPVINSGGHDHHDDQRPMGMLTNATGETDENGVFTTTFISSEISGVEWIIASSSQISHRDSASIKVEIPNLSNFADIESEKWRLTGNTGSTSYGPCFGRELQHQNNHYLTSVTKNNLQGAIKSFFNWTGTEEGVGNLVVGMNDMSLSKGGLFDICSNWDIGHNSHRLGIDADIDRIATIFNSTTENIDLRAEENLYLLQKLEEFIRIKGGVRIKSLGLHFRFIEN